MLTVEDSMIDWPTPPKILSGRLVFGDAEQIAALREYEALIEKFKCGELQEWVVDIEISHSETVTVTASSRKEAEEIALESIDFNDLDDISATARPKNGCHDEERTSIRHFREAV